MLKNPLNSDRDGNEMAALQRRVAELETQIERLQDAVQYRSVFESHNDAIIIADAFSGQFIDCNTAAEELTGYTREALLSLRAGQLSPEIARTETEHQWQILLSRGALRSQQNLLTKDGRLIPVDVNSRILRVNDRTYVQGVFREMTQQKETEEQLRAGLRQLELVYELSTALSRTRQLDEIYNSALDAIQEALHTDRVSLLLADETGTMRFTAWRHLSNAYRATMEGYSPWAANEPDPQLVLFSDIRDHPTFAPFHPSLAAEGIAALALIPLTYEGRLLGRFTAYFDAPRSFANEEVWLAQTVANHVAFAIERRRTRQALQRERELLQTIFDQIPVMIAMHRPDTRVTQLNQAFERITGWTTEEARQVDLMEKCYPDPNYREEVRTYMAALKPEWRDIQMTAKDGSIIETSWWNVRLSDDTHIGIGIDIGERKKGEERFRAIFDKAPCGILLLTNDSIFLDANPALCRILGYSHHEIVGQPVDRFIPTGMGLRNEIQEHIYKTGHWHGEHPLVNKAGDLVQLEWWVSDFIVPGTWLVIANDITERKQAQEALRESEQRYRFLSEITSDYIFSYRRRAGDVFQLEWISDAFNRITGYTPEEIAQREQWNQFIYPDDVGSVHEFIARMHANQPHVMEHRFVAKNGETRWLRVFGRPIWNEATGRVDQILGAGQDISAEKEAEAALIELNETLEQRVRERTAQVRALASQLTLAEQRERHRVAQILHDHLQQLLYAIQFRAHLLQYNATPEQLAMLKQFGHLLNDAIRTTRTLTVDLSPPVLEGEGLVEALHWLANQMQVSHQLCVNLDMHNYSYVPRPEMRVLLFQIVRELLFNVVKHAGVDEATIRLHQEDGQLTIVVEDGGKGFNPATLSSNTDIHTGFGLHNVHERLDLFDGRLELDARPGAGTRATVILPLSLDDPPGIGRAS